MTTSPTILPSGLPTHMALDKECSITSLLMLILTGTLGDQQNTGASEMTGTREETGDCEKVDAGNKTDGDDNQEPDVTVTGVAGPYATRSGSMTPQFPSTSVGDLQALIQRAVNSHNTKYYSDVLAVSIYFSDDDTMAKGDADTFANFAARIGVKHEHLLLSDRHPEFQLLGYLYTSLVKFAIAGKCLLFLHYAGHGTPEEGQYHWYANSGKNSRKVRWSIIRDRLLLSEVASDNEIFGNLDVVCIIDSCHSGLATRGNPMTTRSINIMAACNGAGMARSRQGGITFTQRFVTSCLFQLKSCGTGMLDIAAIGIALSGDSAATKAVWEVLLGTPITLQVGGGQFAAVGSGGPDTVPVILSVHVDTNVEGVAIFINWLKTLKKDFKAFDIEVEFGYPSSSYILGLVCSPVLGHYLELLPGALTLGHKAGKIQVFEKATIRSKCPPLGDRTNSKRSANILEQ